MMKSGTYIAAASLLTAVCVASAPGWAAATHRTRPAVHRSAAAARRAPPSRHGTAPPAHQVAPAAGMVRAQDPTSIVRALQSGGYSAKLGVDKVGDPMVTSAVGGTTFQIFFYNCTNHKECATVQFHSGYDFNKPLPLETVNEWNRSQRFGRAYLDKENDPILEMDVDLDDGGLSPLLFIDNIEFWSTILGKFEQHIGYRK
jgi:hypothetical protein